MNEKQKLSECEEMIMKVIWGESADPNLLTVTEKVNARFNKNWKIQTVATFLTRLQSKGWIKIYRVEKYSHYKALIGLEAYRDIKLAELLELYNVEDSEALEQVALKLQRKIAGMNF